MKTNNESNWLQTFANRYKATALAALMLTSGVALEANVSYTLEGCRSSATDGYDLVQVETPAHTIVPMFLCDDKAYTTGNLKQWAELDYVPHRITIHNKGSKAESFTYTVGGDHLRDVDGDLYGWDRITTLVLNQELSDDECLAVSAKVDQQDFVTADGEGVGGAYTTIYRQIIVTDLPAGVKCVADYNARLAIGSHGYSGSSLQSNLWDENLDSSGVGEKRIQLPDVLEQTFTKNMTASQGITHRWTVEKSTPDSNVVFEDTCAPGADLSKDVSITVSWDKEDPAPAGNAIVTTKYTVTNSTKHDMKVNIADTIYAGPVDDGGVVVGNASCTDKLILAGVTAVVCSVDTEVNSALVKNKILYDVAVLTYIDPLTNEPIETTITALDSTGVLESDNANNEATVKDHEWISSDLDMMSYLVAQPSSGTFDDSNYQSTLTQGDVNWTSIEQTDDGSITFNKTITLAEPMISKGTLSDKATLLATNGDTLADSGETPFKIDIYSYATVTLNITKTIPDILEGEERVDFNFTVTKGTDFSETVIMTFTAGQTTKTFPLTDLEPGTYDVTENPTRGFATEDGIMMQQVTITLPSCSNSVTFNNKLAGQPKVAVRKVTVPATVGGAPQNGNWKMTLEKKDGDNYLLVKSLDTTADADEASYDVFETDGPLDQGTYRITEVSKTSEWHMTGKSNECEFTVEYPRDLNRANFECTYTNTKYARIIVQKITDPAGSDVKFGFKSTGFEGADSADFDLTHAATKNYENLDAGQYTVTEDNPNPGFDLIDLVCTEEGSDAEFNVLTTKSVNDRKAYINLQAGETVSCVFTNRERTKIELFKNQNGAAPTTPWDFVLTGPKLDPSRSATITVGTEQPVDFNDARLVPGATYKLCEMGVPVAWETIWNLNGTVVPVTYTNVNDSEASNEDRCIEFVAATAPQKVTVTIDNNYTPPGGEPRTIGYWKNWNTCSKGGQAATAEANGGSEEGFWILNDVLAQLTPFGAIEELSCDDAVSILNKSELAPTSKKKAKKRASDAAYGMGAQLMAARANYAAGAETCPAATDAIAAGKQLLVDISFDATGSYLSPKAKKTAGEQRTEANRLAGILDSYNNGELCK